ncbi:MAG TPA: serine/threonine-protein kinase [Actinocrinis sp.]|nr:serine/threonine-protein kinase [Actinocrinis sp.]
MPDSFTAENIGTAPPPAPFEPLAGDDPAAVGGYRLRARLGAGGMGRVYLAFTPGGRALALKVVRPEFAEDPEFRERFAQEIRAAQRVNGVYTAQVVDAGPDAAQPWLATAYVPGPSLAAAVRRFGPLPVRTVLLLTGAVAESLAAIHAAGVVHRDLKPANVVLAEDGPRVIDFGIARAADSTPLTATGIRIGTPQYMAPEQALGQSAEPATDLFSLGSLAFYAATGRTPFGEGQEMAVLYRVVNEQPDLSACPPDLVPLVQACLTKDPAQRITGPALIDLCRRQAGGDLRITAGWLPSAVASEATRRTVAAPAEQAAGAAAAAVAAAPLFHPPLQPQPMYVPPQPIPQPAPPPIPAPAKLSGAEKRAAVRAAALPPPTESPTQTPNWGRRLLLGALAVVVVAGGGAIAAVSLDGKGSPPSSTGHNPSLNALTTIGATTAPAAEQNPNTLVNPTTAPDAPLVPFTTPAAVPNATGQAVTGNNNPPGTPLGTFHVDLAAGYGFNLTSDLSSPGRAVLNDSGVNFDVDFPSSYDDYIEASTSNATMAILQPGTAGSYQNCLNDTQYINQLNAADLSVGTSICDITPRGRVALLQITHLPAQGDPSTYIGFSITLWQGAISVGQ